MNLLILIEDGLYFFLLNPVLVDCSELETLFESIEMA